MDSGHRVAPLPDGPGNEHRGLMVENVCMGVTRTGVVGQVMPRTGAVYSVHGGLIGHVSGGQWTLLAFERSRPA